MPGKKKRELIDVDVTDLALVDNGANQKPFNVIKRQPPTEVEKKEGEQAPSEGAMPTHEALVEEKTAALKGVLPQLTAAIGVMDLDMARACMSKMRDLMWAVSSLMQEMAPAEVMKRLSDEAFKNALIPGIDAILKIAEKGGTPMATEQAAELKKREEQQEAAEEAVKKALSDLPEDGRKQVLDAITKAYGTPAVAPVAAQPSAEQPSEALVKEVGELRKRLDDLIKAGAQSKEVEAITKRLDELEKVGVSKTAAGDLTPQPKSKWEGSAFADLVGK